VRHALPVQERHDIEQVATVALQQVQAQPTVCLQLPGQRRLARVLKQQSGAPADCDRIADELGHLPVLEATQPVGLIQ